MFSLLEPKPDQNLSLFVVVVVEWVGSSQCSIILGGEGLLGKISENI